MPAMTFSGPEADPAAPVVTRAEAFCFWLKLGFHQFWRPGRTDRDHARRAGGAPPLDQRKRRFLHALNYCMVLPGPEAQQLATYIGWLMHRTWGGVVAGVLFVLPSLFILIRCRGSISPSARCRWWRVCSTASSPPSRPLCAGRASHRLAGAEKQLCCGRLPGPRLSPSSP
jgi:hypothetical protein